MICPSKTLLFKCLPLLTIAFLFGSLPSTAFAVQESEPIEKPTLAAIASMLPEDATDLNDLNCFQADGKPIDEATMKQFKLRLKAKDFQYPDHVNERPENLQPIILVFSVDTRLIDSGVLPLLSIDGEQIPARSFKVKDNEGFLTAILLPPQEMTEWPDSCELTVRYADQNPVAMKEYSGPFGAKVQLGEGTYCQMIDKFGVPRLAFSKPQPTEEWPTEYFSLIVKLHDESELKVETLEMRSSERPPAGSMDFVQIYESCSPDDIQKVTVMKKTLALEKFGTIRLRPNR